MGVHIPISKDNYEKIKEKELHEKFQLQIYAKNSIKDQKFWKLAPIIIGLETLFLAVFAASLVLTDFFMEKIALCLLTAIALITLISGLILGTSNTLKYCTFLGTFNIIIIILFFLLLIF